MTSEQTYQVGDVFYFIGVRMCISAMGEGKGMVQNGVFSYKEVYRPWVTANYVDNRGNICSMDFQKNFLNQILKNQDQHKQQG